MALPVSVFLLDEHPVRSDASSSMRSRWRLDRNARTDYVFTAFHPSDEPATTTQDLAVQTPGKRYSSENILRLINADPDHSTAIWDEIFQSTSSGVPDQILTEAIALLHEQKYYDAAVEGLLSAIRNGYPASWMYDVLAVEMSLAGRPQKDITRVIESRVDFAAADLPQMLLAIAMLSRFEAWDEANRMAVAAAELDPLQPEVWLLSRSVADKSGDVEHRVRSRCGILQHLWTDDFNAQHEEARTVLIQIARQLEARGKTQEANDVRHRMSVATEVDLQFILRWVGNADLDLTVRQPNGETCDFKNRAPQGGGRLIREEGLAFGDRNAARRSAEHYLCHTASNGRYDATVRFVLGKVVGGTAVLEVIRHAGTPHEIRTIETVQLGKDEFQFTIDLTDGRATEPVAPQ